MEQFLNDEIDMILDGMNSDLQDGAKEFTLSEEQRNKIIDALRNGYDYIWEDLYDALNGEISNCIE